MARNETKFSVVKSAFMAAALTCALSMPQYYIYLYGPSIPRLRPELYADVAMIGARIRRKWGIYLKSCSLLQKGFKRNQSFAGKET